VQVYMADIACTRRISYDMVNVSVEGTRRSTDGADTAEFTHFETSSSVP